MTERDTRPEWWVRSANVKAELDLPEYEPPRFSDGTYVHEVVEPLEESHGCSVQFGAINPRYPDDWYVRVDGERADLDAGCRPGASLQLFPAMAGG